GTTPETIASMAKVLPELRPIRTKRASVTVTQPPRTATAPRSQQQLDRPTETLLDIIHQRTLIVTELDPPKSLALSKLIDGAQALKEAGSDFITLADNTLAILRVANVAAAFIVKEQPVLEPLITRACRDH